MCASPVTLIYIIILISSYSYLAVYVASRKLVFVLDSKLSVWSTKYFCSLFKSRCFPGCELSTQNHRLVVLAIDCAVMR